MSAVGQFVGYSQPVYHVLVCFTLLRLLLRLVFFILISFSPLFIRLVHPEPQRRFDWLFLRPAIWSQTSQACVKPTFLAELVLFWQ